MLKKIVNIVNGILPKKNRILFNSFPDIGGNALMLYRYMVDSQPQLLEKYEVVWTINGDGIEEAKELLSKTCSGQKVKVLRKKSLSGLLSYCGSKYIISTHNYITGVRTCKGQKHYNLWHGMPFKAIGNMLGNSGEGDVIQADYTLATGDVFQEIMSKAFALPKENVMITGQPCNDLLFSDSHALEKMGISKEADTKVILWMPTYRKSVVGSIREDGDANAFGVAEVVQQHLSEFTKLLKEQKILLLVKPHPMDIICNMEVAKNDYLKIVKNDDLDRAGVALYELLAEADVLFTDYSSVFIDYLNLERPMAFVCDDMESYAANRGFCFEPAKDYLPGAMIRSYHELTAYLQNMEVENESWKEQRQRLNRLFNRYSDAHSSKRVYEFIFEQKR